MKKIVIFTALAAALAVPAGAEYKSGYYDAMEGLRKEALKQAAKTCVAQHTELVYKELPTYWQYTDVYPELYEGSTRWWEMYSNNIYLIYPGQSALASFSACKMQREHSIPKSWWKSNGDVEYTPAYTDLWNLYPSDGAANQAKLNYPFGETDSPKYDNGCSLVGPAVSGQGGGCGMVFEPADEYKGDFARSIFYMATVYDDLPWVINYMFQKDSPWPTLRDWAYNLLLQWSRQDPVDQKEIDRNDAVENCQGNRNPFIDFPELAEYIWGTRTSETFILSEQGGSVTSPITGDPEITSPVNGSALQLGEAYIGQTITAPIRIEGANLTGPLSVRVTGQDKSMFTLSTNSIPASTINQGVGYLLNVYYTPTSIGVHEAYLRLYDGGLDISDNVEVQLIGEGFTKPNLSTLTAYDATDIDATGYTASWSEAPEVVDYYVVTRLRYTQSGIESETIEANETSLRISDREADVAESYTVQSSRLGLLSEPSNSIVVAAGTGIGQLSDVMPCVAIVNGGIMVTTDYPCELLEIYDVSGRIVMSLAYPPVGEVIELPQGIYFVKTNSISKTAKIAIL